MKKDKLSALVFDLDGTLIDSKQDVVNSANCILKKYQLPVLSESEEFEVMKSGFQTILKSRLSGKTSHATEQHVFSDFKSVYSKNYCNETQLFPNIKQVLESYLNLPKFILSNKSEEFILPILHHLEISSFFHSVFGRNSFDLQKPAPVGIFKISGLLGISPVQIVMIGDSDIDIKTGKNAGAKTCGVHYGYSTHDALKLEKPDFEVYHPNEFIGLFS
jgi:phosphoglycolate phosphatase